MGRDLDVQRTQVHGRVPERLTIRIAAIEVGHWYSLFDAACLKTLAQMPEVQLVGVQNPDARMAAGRAHELGGRAATGPRTATAQCVSWIARTLRLRLKDESGTMKENLACLVTSEE